MDFKTRVDKFVEDNRYEDDAKNELFRRSLLELLADLGLPESGIRLTELDEE